MSTIKTFSAACNIPSADSLALQVIRNRVSFEATSVTAADVVEVLKIPKGFLVLTQGSIVLQAEGATCTATVGDGDSANSWDASLDLNSATCQMTTPSDTYGALGGKHYRAADTIDWTMGHDTDAAIVSTWAVGLFAIDIGSPAEDAITATS